MAEGSDRNNRSLTTSSELKKTKEQERRDDSTIRGVETRTSYEAEKVILDEEFPDGGTRAWLCLFGSFLLSAVCYGVLNSFGVFQEYYRLNNLSHRSIQDISWIGSLQLCLNLLVGCVSGPLFDAGYLKHLIATGGTLYVFSLMMTSISKEYYQFVLAQGVGIGLAAGCLFTPGVSVLAHHFKRRRNLVFGIFAAGASVSGAVLPIATQRLLRQVGFGWTIRILGFIVLACVSIAFFCCSTRLPPRKGATVVDFRVFKSVAYSFLVFGAGFVALGLYVPLTYGITYAVQHGVNQQLAFYSLAILNACSIIGRTLPNMIAQRVGPLNVLIAACLLSAVMLFSFTATQTTAGILTYNAFFGIASGTYVSGLPPACSSLTLDPRETGLRLGMMFFTTSFFWLASSPIQGSLIRLHGTFWPASVYSGACVALGVSLMLAARYLASRAKRTHRV